MTLSSRCPGSSGVEQWIENPRVGGSIPPLGTIFTNKYNDLTLRFARISCVNQKHTKHTLLAVFMSGIAMLNTVLADAVLATVIVLLISALHAQTHTSVDLSVRPAIVL